MLEARPTVLPRRPGAHAPVIQSSARRRLTDEVADRCKRLVGLVAPHAMAGVFEDEEERSGDRFRELFLVTNCDERVELTRQDQCWAADPSELRTEIDPPDLVSQKWMPTSSRKMVRANTSGSPLLGL
jgi:hypothetical protein